MIEPTDQTGLWIQNKESLEQAYTMELDILKRKQIVRNTLLLRA